MANIREWPKNDESLETSLMIGLPEELGIIQQVRVHINLDNGTYICIDAIYQCSVERLNFSLPIIFKEETKEKILINNANIAIFGIIYQIENEAFLNGSFYTTFEAWKNEYLGHYFTETIKFDIKNY